MKYLQRPNVWFVLILILYIFYAGLFIYQTSFIVDGTRYFLLFDDAAISMTYAKNLANGHGLVWNPGGERVEGYTNLLWVIFMAGFHLLPIDASKIAVTIQISGAVLLLINLIYVRKIAQQLTNNPLIALFAVVLTAFYFPLNNWTLQGMEVGAQTLLVSISVWLTLHHINHKTFSFWPYLILGTSTWIRLDGVVIYLIVLAAFLLCDGPHRRRNLIWGLTLLVVFMGAQTLFRYGYYGELLPNTYYLKMTGYPFLMRVVRGFYVFGQFVWSMNWFLFLLPLAILIFRRDWAALFLLAAMLAQMAYSIYVGGDAWEHKGGANRYISVVMPIFFALFSVSTEQIWNAFRYAIKNTWLRRTESLGLIIFFVVSMFNFNMLVAPNDLSVLDGRKLANWLALRPPIFVQGNDEKVRLALAVRKITKEQASFAVVAAGNIPYLADRHAIDLLGKSDYVIAREPSRPQEDFSQFVDFRPGHSKWNYAYTIGELQPDLVVQLWGDDAAKPYLQTNYTAISVDGFVFYARNDSSNINWAQGELVQ